MYKIRTPDGNRKVKVKDGISLRRSPGHGFRETRHRWCVVRSQQLSDSTRFKEKGTPGPSSLFSTQSSGGERSTLC